MQKFPQIYYSALQLSKSNVVLTKSTNPLMWDSWGVRDVAPLSDEYGGWIQNEGKSVFFYTGSSIASRGYHQQTGAASLCKGDSVANRCFEQPFVQAGQSSFSNSVMCTPWVIKLVDNSFVGCFRAAESVGKNECVCIRSGSDVNKLKEEAGERIINNEIFDGLRKDVSLMGVLNVCRVNEYFLILFEGYESGYEKRGQIFGALTSDWKTFAPANNGQPIFTGRQVTSWPVKGVCNPRLIRLLDGWFMLGFNGTHSGEYSIGLAFTKDFKNWYEHPANPILVPRGWPTTDEMTGRLEGPCFDRNAILAGDKTLTMYFMAIPYGARNHENAVIASVEFVTTKSSENANYHELKYFPKNPQAISQDKTSFKLLASKEESGFLHAHRISAMAIKSLSFRFEEINFGSTDSAAMFVVLSNTLNSLPRGLGQIVKITKNKVFLYEEIPAKADRSGTTKLAHKLIKQLMKIPHLLRFKHKYPIAPRWGWRQLKLDAAFNLYNIVVNNKTTETEYNFDKPGSAARQNKLILKYQGYRIITFAVYNVDVKIEEFNVIPCLAN